MDGGKEKTATGLKGEGEFSAEKKGDSGNRQGARKTKRTGEETKRKRRNFAAGVVRKQRDKREIRNRGKKEENR